MIKDVFVATGWPYGQWLQPPHRGHDIDTLMWRQSPNHLGQRRERLRIAVGETDTVGRGQLNQVAACGCHSAGMR